jgi:hypothetical protein
MTERTTVRLPDDLVRRAKLKAASDGRSLTALIADGLRRVLNEDALTVDRGRTLPPVSRATGGLMPGIDLNDSARIWEAEDLETIARIG